MQFLSALARFVIAFTLIFSTLPASVPVTAQDIVSSDDITGGASVFVFRQSRKKPQERSSSSTASAFMMRGKAGTDTRGRMNKHIAANWRKKRTPSAADIKAARTAALKRRIALSNTMAANADKALDAGNTDAAITGYRNALKQYAKNTNATLGLSEALTAKGIAVAGESNDRAATVFLEEAVVLNDKNDIAFAKLGEIYDASDDNANAIANYEKAVRVTNSFPAVYVPLGLVYMETGEVAKAEGFVTRATNAGPQTAELEYLRGLVLFRQNKNAEALVAFEKAIELDSDYVSAYYYRGQIFDRLERTDNAIASYKSAIDKDPQFSAAYYDLGVVYYNSGQYENAAGAYTEAIRYEPANGKAHANLASSYRQLGRYGEANEEYKAAAVTITKDPDLYSEWGYCLGKTNEWDKSVARLETAHTLSPTAIDNTNVGWGYYNAAQADMAAKNEAAAKEKLEKSRLSLQSAVDQDPRLDAAYLNLGSTNNALGNYDDAVTALNTALSLHDNWVIALNQLGLGYRGQKNLAGALQAFNRAVNLDGNYVAGLFNLGKTQYASGDKKGAKKTQDRLAKLDSSLAGQLGKIIAGQLIDEATRQIKKSIPIPLPF